MTRTITNYAGCKALVVGLGDTGASCVRWLIEHDAQVRATDTREEPPHAQRIREAFPVSTRPISSGPTSSSPAPAWPWPPPSCNGR